MANAYGAIPLYQRVNTSCALQYSPIPAQPLQQLFMHCTNCACIMCTCIMRMMHVHMMHQLLHPIMHPILASSNACTAAAAPVQAWLMHMVQYHCMLP